MKIFETENSRYEIDDVEMKYRRTAKGQTHVPSHRLVYGEWLPLAKWQVEPAPDTMGYAFTAPELRPPVLRIWAEDSVHGIVTTPIVWMEA